MTAVQAINYIIIHWFIFHFFDEKLPLILFTCLNQLSMLSILNLSIMALRTPMAMAIIRSLQV